VSSPQNYPFLPPNLAQQAARNQQMMEGAAAVRAAQQAGLGYPQPAVRRRRWFRGLVAVVIAVGALVEMPVQFLARHDGPGITAAVIFVLFSFAARRDLRRPR
jgi:hypothetical protein